jgi:hypothetical protein
MLSKQERRMTRPACKINSSRRWRLNPGGAAQMGGEREMLPAYCPAV